MAVFIYRAVDRLGELVDGRMSADNLDTARKKLELLYKEVLSLEEPTRASSGSVAHRRSPRVKLQNLALYCRQLAVMVQAGISINRAFHFLAGGEDHNLNIVMKRVAHDIEGGMSVARALSEQPRVFNQLFVGLASAGEFSGTLDKSLHKLSDMLERQVTLQKKVQSALSYPLVILVVSVAVAFFFAFYILPQMMPVFLSIGVELPWPTRVLVQVTTLIQNPWVSIPLLLAGVLGIVLGLGAYQKMEKNSRVRYAFDLNVSKIPVVGELVMRGSQAKVLYTLSTMLDAGTPLVETLQTSESVANSSVLIKKLRGARESVVSGVPFHEALTLYECFPSMPLAMIKVGEETGALSQMTGRVAVLIEEDVSHQLDSLASLIEPLIMGAMGILVGFITVASFLPLVQLITTL